MSLASQFEQQLYKVTTTESAAIALSLFQARKNYYDIVIADLHMPEMDIYEFVQKVLHQRVNTPIILTAEDSTMDSAREALGNGVCYLFSKPPSHRDIATVWQHISRVTGQMPSLTETNYIDVEIFCNPSSGSSSDSAARNKKWKNLKRKMMNTDKENIKRTTNQIAENSDSSNVTDEDDGRKPKKSRMIWTSALHQKFLQAINILGEHRAQPKTLLRLMNEPGLTHPHVSSHLQKYRDRRRRSNNLQKTASPVMPAVLPAASLNNFIQGRQTFGTANINCMAARGTPHIPRSPSWLKPPNFVGYILDGMKQNLDTLNYSGNDSMNAFINNRGVKVPEGSNGVQIAQGIDQIHNSNENPSENIGEQTQVFSQSFGHVIPASGHLCNGLQVPNQELAGASGYLIPESGYLSNGFQAPNQKLAGAGSDLIPESGQLSNGLQAPNQEPAGAGSHLIPASGHLRNGLQAPNQDLGGDFGTGLCGFGNAGNLWNMNNANFGEGTTGSNQQFDGMPSNDDINKMIQELEASGANLIWDLIN